MWYDKFIIKENDGSYTIYAEDQCYVIGNYATKKEALKALYEYSRTLDETKAR